MTQEQKELLLKDLCARLPYGVKLQHSKNTDSIVELYSIDLDDFYCKIQFYSYKGKALTVSDQDKLLRPGGILRYKPYLFPLSSMTEEQLYEVSQIIGKDVAIFTDYLLTIDHRRRTFSYQELDALFNWFDKNHFDYRGLIPMGLAIDATNLNIYRNQTK